VAGGHCDLLHLLDVVASARADHHPAAARNSHDNTFGIDSINGVDAIHIP